MMHIIPAIDLLDGRAVRLVKGDYRRVTVYSDCPWQVAKKFENQKAKYLHLVDLDGAKNGNTANFETIQKIAENTDLSIEVGGGIRNLETVERYLDVGADRIILGTAAVTDPEFLGEAIRRYASHIVVGVDIRDERVAICGWTETSDLSCFDFCTMLQNMGVQTVICTDISKDGMMEGPNLSLYRRLSEQCSMNVIASGGVSSMENIRALSDLNLFGAIVGKALYTGAVNLEEAITETEGRRS